MDDRPQMMSDRAPNLTQAERLCVIEFIAMSRLDRKVYFADLQKHPHISGSLLHVLRYLIVV